MKLRVSYGVFNYVETWGPVRGTACVTWCFLLRENVGICVRVEQRVEVREFTKRISS